MSVYTGLDLSRKRLDWYCCRVDGTRVDAGAVPPDLDGLARLAHRLGDADVVAVIETTLRSLSTAEMFTVCGP